MHETKQLSVFGTKPALSSAQETPPGNSERQGDEETISLAVNFPLPWMRERANRLHRFCKTVERRRAGGMSVRKAVKHFAWFWKDHPYRTAPHIKTKFSRAALVCLYYRWRRNGKSPECFALHYGDRLPPVTPEQIRRFVRACGTGGAVSISQAARLAGFERAIACRIRARLPARLVRRIKGVFKERRQAELEAEAAVKHFQRDMRLRLEADQRRGRNLHRAWHGAS